MTAVVAEAVTTIAAVVEVVAAVAVALAVAVVVVAEVAVAGAFEKPILRLVKFIL